jgi:hypothetical protein
MPTIPISTISISTTTNTTTTTTTTPNTNTTQVLGKVPRSDQHFAKETEEETTTNTNIATTTTTGSFQRAGRDISGGIHEAPEALSPQIQPNYRW